MVEVRILSEAGIALVRDFVVQLKTDPTAWPPPDILNDTRYTTPAPGGATVENRSFSSKLDFGRYISGVLNECVPERILRTSIGLWVWLTLFYFDQVCPTDRDGRRKALSLEKYIPSTGHISTNPDKHLLFFPWKMVTLHRDDAAWLLGSALREDTKVVRELANSYRRNVSTEFVRLARSLYFDARRGKVRTGATTNRAGSLRRLDRVVSQLDLTYDVFGMDAASLAVHQRESSSGITSRMSLSRSTRFSGVGRRMSALRSLSVRKSAVVVVITISGSPAIGDDQWSGTTSGSIR